MRKGVQPLRAGHPPFSAYALSPDDGGNEGKSRGTANALPLEQRQKPRCSQTAARPLQSAFSFISPFLKIDPGCFLTPRAAVAGRATDQFQKASEPGSRTAQLERGRPRRPTAMRVERRCRQRMAVRVQPAPSVDGDDASSLIPQSGNSLGHWPAEQQREAQGERARRRAFGERQPYGLLLPRHLLIHHLHAGGEADRQLPFATFIDRTGRTSVSVPFPTQG